jgi:hypothetical protein
MGHIFRRNMFGNLGNIQCDLGDGGVGDIDR